MWSLVFFYGCLISTFASYIPTDRIVGGYPVSIEQRPFQVSIVLYGSHFCGGSIIRKDVILTAAHCLFEVSTDYMQVRVGSTQRDNGGKVVAIRKIAYHENYDDATEGLDVGLIWLKEPLDFNDKVQPIALANQNEKFPDGALATVSGWGRVTFMGELSNVLQEVKVPFVKREICAQEYHGLVNMDMICAGLDAGGKDACQMDSGGPLTFNGKQVGIVSFGYECARPNYAGVYTNVAQFRDWIDRKIQMG